MQALVGIAFIFCAAAQGIAPETPKKKEPHRLEYYAAMYIAEQLIKKNYGSTDPLSLRRDIDALQLTEVTREMVEYRIRDYIQDLLRKLDEVSLHT